MKIFIAGATGRVGTLLIHDLLQDGHEIIAGARHPERVKIMIALFQLNLIFMQALQR